MREELNRRIIKIILLLFLWCLIYGLILFAFSGCRLRGAAPFRPVLPHETEQSFFDTVRLSIVPVEQISGTFPALGDSLIIPSAGVKMIRISEKNMLIQSPIRRERLTKTEFVPVKTIDKSRTDNRSYNDSYNKSKQDNDIKDKSRVIEKEINKNGLPWWLILLFFLSVIVLGLYYYFRGKINKFLP